MGETTLRLCRRPKANVLVVMDAYARWPEISDKPQKVSSFSVDQEVLVKNYRGGEKWLNGVITKILGAVTYMVNVEVNSAKRHVNQMLNIKPRRQGDALAEGDGSLYVGGSWDYDVDDVDMDNANTVPQRCEQRNV